MTTIVLTLGLVSFIAGYHFGNIGVGIVCMVLMLCFIKFVDLIGTNATQFDSYYE